MLNSNIFKYFITAKCQAKTTGSLQRRRRHTTKRWESGAESCSPAGAGSGRRAPAFAGGLRSAFADAQMLYRSVGMDSWRVTLAQTREGNKRCCPRACAPTAQAAAQKMPASGRLAPLGKNPRPCSTSFVPRPVAEPQLAGTDPSPGQSLAAAIYL